MRTCLILAFLIAFTTAAKAEGMSHVRFYCIHQAAIEDIAESLKVGAVESDAVAVEKISIGHCMLLPAWMLVMRGDTLSTWQDFDGNWRSTFEGFTRNGRAIYFLAPAVGRPS